MLVTSTCVHQSLKLQGQNRGLDMMVMTLWEKRCKISESLQGSILCAVKQQLEDKRLRAQKVIRHIDWSVEVWDNKQHKRHIIELFIHDCLCLEPQYIDKPCDHYLCLMTTRRNMDIEDYVHEYYSLEKFKASYMRVLQSQHKRRYNGLRLALFLFQVHHL